VGKESVSDGARIWKGESSEREGIGRSTGRRKERKMEMMHFLLSFFSQDRRRPRARSS
jgi:hypothetical protein